MNSCHEPEALPAVALSKALQLEGPNSSKKLKGADPPLPPPPFPPEEEEEDNVPSSSGAHVVPEVGEKKKKDVHPDIKVNQKGNLDRIEGTKNLCA